MFKNPDSGLANL